MGRYYLGRRVKLVEASSTRSYALCWAVKPDKGLLKSAPVKQLTPANGTK